MKTMILAAAAAAALAMGGTAAAQSYNPNSSYADPDSTTTQVYQTTKKVCNDPWVTIALIRVFGSADPAKCAPGLYNGGNWGSFDSLVKAVNATKSSLNAAGADLKPVKLADGTAGVGVFVGGNLVAAGGGNLVAAGGGNLVAAGGGNMTWSSLVAAGGGNIIVPSNTPPANLVAAGGGNYTVLSVGRSVKLPVGGLRW